MSPVYNYKSANLQALLEAGVEQNTEAFQKLEKLKCGILIGTAMGGMQTFATAVEDLASKVSLNVLTSLANLLK